LKGKRSGTFWPFWHLLKALADEGRAPALIVLENVCGALTSHRGKDLVAIGAAFAEKRYRFGAIVMDAAHFVPQSRPRLFIVGVRRDLPIPEGLIMSQPNGLWHPAHLCAAYIKLSNEAKDAWVWWKLPPPPERKQIFSDLIEDDPQGVPWHTGGGIAAFWK
jgi:DNA (cytosine-5)-methyltransferase 1